MAVWPPNVTFEEFIKNVNGTAFNYDVNDLQNINLEKCRYAAHCVLWSKTDNVFKTRRGEIPMKALIMVRF